MPDLAPLPLLLDTDLGDDIDDAFALAVCLRHPGLDLRGVTTVRGDTSLRAAQVRYLCALAGRPDLPVAAGSRDALDAPVAAERNCQAGVLPAAEEERWRTGREDGVRALAEWALDSPGAVLLTIGPLTNAGRLATEFPAAFASLSQVVIMGGHLLPDVPHAEWNLVCDPRAAEVVVSAGVPVTLVGLDVTLQCQMAAADLDRLGALEDPLAAALMEMTRLWQGVGGSYRPDQMPVLHDPLAALALAEPALVEFQEVRLWLDEGGGCHPGRDGTPVQWTCGVDGPAVVQRVVDLVAGG